MVTTGLGVSGRGSSVCAATQLARVVIGESVPWVGWLCHRNVCSGRWLPAWLLPVLVDQSVERQAILPAGGEVGHINVGIAAGQRRNAASPSGPSAALGRVPSKAALDGYLACPLGCLEVLALGGRGQVVL